MMSTAIPEIFSMAPNNGADALHATEVVAAIAASIVNLTTNILAENSTQGSIRQGVSSRRRNRVTAMPSPSPSVAIHVLDALNAAYMPVIIYLGLIGNLLSLVTFLSTKLRNRTSSLYMGALAVSDSGFLIVLSFAWLNERGINVYQHGLCLVTVFLTSTFACWSVWLTVSFTAERFVAVRYPLWKLQTSSPSRRPRLVIGVTALLSIVLNTPLLVFVRVDSEFSQCSLHPDYESALYYLNILDTVLTFILPFLLITVMNSMIARAIYLFYARYKKQRSMDGCNEDCRESASSSPRRSGSLVMSRDATTTATSGGGIAHATQISVTRMLLLVSTVFILLNLPSYVMRIYVFLLSLGLSHSTDHEINSLPYVLQRYFMLLYYTNFSINFVLYNASSRMFRVTLCDYVQGRWMALRKSMAAIRSSLGRSSSSQNEDIII
ncbi:thyrotropin-releasing hormone receptor-like [Amblyomma americanum]